jgi:bifunctional DNA-binding transcriptional regulator/antitoxin component of YhaV-PrlF toxin-antitoxin module
MIELTVTAKGQITIKKSLLDGLGARVGDKLHVDVRPDGGLVIPPLRRTGKISDAFGMIKPLPGTPPISIEEMNEIIAKGWAGEL